MNEDGKKDAEGSRRKGTGGAWEVTITGNKALENGIKGLGG